MEREEVEKKLKFIIADKLDTHEDMISDESLLVDDLGMDSVSALEVLFDIEAELNIKIDRENLPDIKTFGDICDYVSLIIQS